MRPNIIISPQEGRKRHWLIRGKGLLALMATALAGVFVLHAAAVVAEGTLASVQQGALTSTEGICSITDGDMTLTYSGTDKALTLREKDGTEWCSSITETVYDFDKLNESWKKNVTSFATIQYTTVKDINPSVKTAYSSERETTVQAEADAGKLTLSLSYSAGISFRIVFSLENGMLVCSIPQDSIQEKGKFQLLSIELLPYLGASNEQMPGYMVYPDGSGALKYHKSDASDNVRNMAYTWGVYGDDLQSLDTLEQNRNSDIMPAFLPVFGIKNQSHALVAFATKGEADSLIVMHPAGDSININRISFTFQYRTWYNIALSNIKINGTDTAENPNGKKYNETMIKQDREVRYRFLNGDSADYSGMAVAYRQYLLDSGELQKSQLLGKLDTSVSLFMGAQAESMFSSSMVTATTVSQTEKVMEAVADAGSRQPLFTLKGWSKDGYGSYPQPSKFESSLGSKGQFQKLLEQHKNICMQIDLFTVGKDQGGYSLSRDVIKTGNQVALTNTTEDLFLFNIASIKERLNAFTGLTEAAGGYAFDNMGNLLYPDYNQKATASKEQMKAELEKLLAKLSQERIVTTEGGNLYTLADTDLIYQLPDTSSGYFISDESIPFCQVVLSGSIPYTGQPGNLSADYEEQLLKWLEYGYTPYFELTYENSDVLKDTDYNTLFTSVYTMHLDKIQKASDSFHTVQEAVGNGRIMHHQTINGNLQIVTYENGAHLLFNYSDQDVTYEGLQIKAKSYGIKA